MIFISLKSSLKVQESRIRENEQSMAKIKENQAVIQPEHKDGCQSTVQPTKMCEALIVVSMLPWMSYNL